MSGNRSNLEDATEINKKKAKKKMEKTEEAIDRCLGGRRKGVAGGFKGRRLWTCGGCKIQNGE